MRLTPLFLLVALGLCATAVAELAPTPPPGQRKGGLDETYHALVAANDTAGLIELWKANEGRVLGTLDRDLEGSLALWEAAQGEEGSDEVALDDETRAKIAEMHARATMGAKAASEAFGRPIFQDYAASFLSWDAADKRNFRAGQAAFGEAMQAMREPEGAGLERAKEEGERCSQLALPLGDWWGYAMGLGASGRAKLGLGDLEGALGDLSRARLFDQALGLTRSELGDLDGMLACLEGIERWSRAKGVLDVLVERTEGEVRSAYEARLEAVTGKL